MTKAHFAVTMVDVAMIGALSQARLAALVCPRLSPPRPHSSAAPPALLRPQTLKKRTQTQHKGGGGPETQRSFPCAARNLAPPPCFKHILLYTSGVAPLGPFALGVSGGEGWPIRQNSPKHLAKKTCQAGFFLEDDFAPTPSACKLLAFIVTNLVAWRTAGNLASLPVKAPRLKPPCQQLCRSL